MVEEKGERQKRTKDKEGEGEGGEGEGSKRERSFDSTEIFKVLCCRARERARGMAGKGLGSMNFLGLQEGLTDEELLGSRTRPTDMPPQPPSFTEWQQVTTTPVPDRAISHRPHHLSLPSHPRHQPPLARLPPTHTRA